MSTQSNALPQAEALAPSVPATIPPGQRFYWSVRRELFEYRSIYLAPLIAAALGMIALTFGVGHMHASMAASDRSAEDVADMLVQPFEMIALLIMGTTFILSIFYCLEALHGERRDRSILFWKSLPVSDLTTVLAKASIPIVLLPLITFLVTVVTQWVMFLWSGALLAGTGVSFGLIWRTLSLPQSWLMLFFHLMLGHGLWYAPFYGWFLLVSAWAKRLPFLWAILPPLGVGAFEIIAFRTTHFMSMITHRLGGNDAAFPVHGVPMAHSAMLHFGQFLASPGLWIGLLITAGFLYGAIQLRRYRGPI